jgi:peptidoglycan/LPS O-acetylase OafA/YrhL
VACGRAVANDAPIYASDLLVGTAIAAICYAMTGAPRGPIYHFLVWRPVVYLGTFSYSLYLMHHPIAQVLYANRPRWVSGEIGLFWYFVACLPIILLGCWGFYLLFERPFVPKRSPKPAPTPKAHAPAGLPLRVYQQTEP